MNFKFILGYCSSALIEARSYGQKVYYFNLTDDIHNDSYYNIAEFLQELGVNPYVI